MTPSERPLGLALMLLIVWPFALPGATESTASVDRTRVAVGQAVRVTVRVRGTSAPPEIRVPVVPGATVTQQGPPQVIPTLAADLEAKGVLHAGKGTAFLEALRKGADPARMKALGVDPDVVKGMSAANLDRNDHIFTYLVTPSKPGALVIPPFTIASATETTTTKPLTVEVTTPRAHPGVKLTQSLSNPTPLVGEEVLLFVDLYLRRGQVTYAGRTFPHLPVKEMALTVPGLEDTPGLELVRPLSVLVKEAAVEPGKRGFRVNSTPGEVKLDYEPDGAPVADPTHSRRRLIIPLRLRKGGEITLPAARAAGDIYMGSSAGKGTWEAFQVSSAPLSFSVLDLSHRPDRPADFGGAIGPVRVTSRVGQPQVAVGTPFTLHVRVEGGTSVGGLTPPDLAGRPGFRDSFRIRHEEEKTLSPTVREFTYTLRALNPRVTEVPPVPIRWYDPRTSTFASSQSEAVPLQVSPAVQVTPEAPAPSEPVGTSEPAPASEVSTGPLDLFAWAEAVLAAVALGLGVGLTVRAWRRSQRERAQTASRVIPLSRARQDLGKADPTVAQIRRTFEDALRQRFGLPLGELTPAEVASALPKAGVSLEVAQSCAAFLETCLATEFAPGTETPDLAKLAAQAKMLLNQLA